jgi:hypothetical protein
MSATLAPERQQRPPRAGNTHPAIKAAEALVESIVAIKDDATALEYGARQMAAFQQVLRRLVDHQHERSVRLLDVVLPEIRLGYAAAERIRRGAAA